MRKTFIQSLFIAGLLLSSFNASAQKTPFYDRGYAGDIELGFLVKGYPYASISTTHGYCFGSGWFIGLGGAFESGLYPRTMENEAAVPDEWHREGFRTTKYPYEGDMMVKVYLDLRKTFYVKNALVFADVKFGSPFNLAEPFGFGDFVRPTIGMVFRRHWAVSAGVDWSSYPYPDAGTDVVRPKQITLPYVGVSYRF
ncbi:MAG: hypothetical protein IK076_07725 [Bacteroidales bacterium]|nr:hypothetical protein [Bacteroidales bacterium]